MILLTLEKTGTIILYHFYKIWNCRNDWERRKSILILFWIQKWFKYKMIWFNYQDQMLYLLWESIWKNEWKNIEILFTLLDDDF